VVYKAERVIGEGRKDDRSETISNSVILPLHLLEFEPVRFAEKSWLKVLFTDLL
jgi:hypothetical protein